MNKMSRDANDPLTFYLRELATIPAVTRDEESSLLQHVRSHDEFAESAAKRLIEGNLSLIVSIAERHSSSPVPMLDLVEKGNVGLLLALQEFTTDSAESFAAYATTYIERVVVNPSLAEKDELSGARRPL